MLVKLLALLSLSALALQPALAGTTSAAASVVASDEMQVSARTKAVLELDHAYSKALRADPIAARQLGMGDMQSAATNMTRDYNYNTATKLFYLSSTAYCTDNANLHAWDCTSCKLFGDFTVTTVMDDTDNQGFVGFFTQGLPSSPMPGIAANEPLVVVSFRGTVTTDIADWIEDLNFAKATPFASKQYPDAHVHTGFWQAYLNMKPKMLDGLAKAFSASGARAAILVGHSLGAAMAELAALDLKLNNYPAKVYATYTQGTPRAGDAGFAALYSQQIAAAFREIHQADVVPHLPPMLLGFKHGPTEVWFNEAFSSFTLCSPSDGEDAHCADSLLLPISIPDHLEYRGVKVAALCTDDSAHQRLVTKAEQAHTRG